MKRLRLDRDRGVNSGKEFSSCYQVRPTKWKSETNPSDTFENVLTWVVFPQGDHCVLFSSTKRNSGLKHATWSDLVKSLRYSSPCTTTTNTSKGLTGTIIRWILDSTGVLWGKESILPLWHMFLELKTKSRILLGSAMMIFCRS